MWTASIRADSSSPDSVVGDSVDAHLFLQPDQLLDDSLGGGTDVRRAMSMLRMGRDDQAMKKAMGDVANGSGAGRMNGPVIHRQCRRTDQQASNDHVTHGPRNGHAEDGTSLY